MEQKKPRASKGSIYSRPAKVPQAAKKEDIAAKLPELDVLQGFRCLYP